MWLSEEITESHPLFKRIKYVTQQSCEKQETEVDYKNISRKYISFDLRDEELMLLVGMTLNPFGFFQNLQDSLINSKVGFFRVWAEAGIAKRGELHLRKFYSKNPEKFFDIEFENSKSAAMKLVKCKYTINEICSSKRVSLHENEAFSSVMEDFRKNMHTENQQFALESQQREDSNKKEDQKVLSLNSLTATS